jgi:hypothetical protein
MKETIQGLRSFKGEPFTASMVYDGCSFLIGSRKVQAIAISRFAGNACRGRSWHY